VERIDWFAVLAVGSDPNSGEHHLYTTKLRCRAIGEASEIEEIGESDEL
jgi:hypothetical protein